MEAAPKVRNFLLSHSGAKFCPSTWLISLTLAGWLWRRVHTHTHTLTHTHTHTHTHTLTSEYNTGNYMKARQYSKVRGQDFRDT